ncbi:molybdate ABC transporter substrate-binding protein [Flavisphingomonas formosensis]|uniref:molybdate ABC transporter substrate-binding protein n=1 Tax=Flavisphingomonas formosensis TaxID=861534 RepID=UPI0018E01714|nr:substrate-binding domain-containing protein [Sphingomonas formosensis]
MPAAKGPTTMMSALIVRAIVDAYVLPPLDAAGEQVGMVWDPTVALMQRISAGERADGIVAIDWALDELAARGLIDPASRRPFAQAAFGLAVAQGGERFAIGSVEDLRATLLAVPSLVYSRAGASGIYFERLIDALGVGDAVRAKATVIPSGLTGEPVARGDAVLAVQQLSELLAVPGLDVLGPFPDAVQETTDFSAALFADAANRQGAAAFLDQLFSQPVRAACLASGLIPFFE